MNKKVLIDKQALIDELTKTQEKFYEVWMNLDLDKSSRDTAINVYTGIMLVKTYVDQLDEPQAEKVEAHLAEHWNEDIGNVLWWDFPVEEPPYCGTPLDDDFPKYKTHFTELHIPDEVEEEPKWKIINDQKYCLTSIEAGYGNSLHWAFDSTKKRPILFDNEETAMYTAYITGGIVEKVEV
ncbi:hypothetical protein [Enterococcus durans]|uniref:hypothetical protein n=1 Tax=Enterococcus durans TaxID=53345 RepID=UPI001E63A0C6|nr:hypothetical protein [Enterococcus durans]MDB1686618.1 hypothetical protein [Enterococcus durans]